MGNGDEFLTSSYKRPFQDPPAIDTAFIIGYTGYCT
jgi:hypothetical protein